LNLDATFTAFVPAPRLDYFFFLPLAQPAPAKVCHPDL
jgi:hypothetical protein